RLPARCEGVVAGRAQPASDSHERWRRRRLVSHPFEVFYALRRLRDGVTPVQAEGELSSVIRHTERDSPVGTPSAAVLTAVDDHRWVPARPVLSIMLGGAILMLLLTCSSVAGLHLFRAARHDRTVAIQLALGATRHRLTRQAFLESTGVALVATVGAVGV